MTFFLAVSSVLVLGAAVSVLGILVREVPLALGPEDRARARRDLLVLAGLTVAGLVLRHSISLPWPVHPGEPLRSLAYNHLDPRQIFLCLVSMPASVLSYDPLAVCGVASEVLGTLAVPATALLARVWAGRAAGLVAGLAAAASPALVQVSRTGNSSVAVASFLVVALLATEVLARRRTLLAAIAAGLAWTLLFLTAPESVGLAVVPIAWMFADPRLRAASRPAGHAPAVFVPMTLSVAFCAFLLAWGGTPEPAARTDPSYVRSLAGVARATFAGTGPGAISVTAVALLGLAATRGPVRIVAAVAVLDVLAVGALLAGRDGFDAESLRAASVIFGVPALAVLHVLAGAAAAFAWGAGGGLFRRSAVIAAGVAVLVAHAFDLDRVRLPTPLQAEHRFLASHVAELSGEPEFVVFGEERPDVRVQVAYRAEVADEEQTGAILGSIVTQRWCVLGIDQARATRESRGDRLHYVRGWAEHDPLVATTASPRRWLEVLESAWEVVPIASEAVEVIPDETHPEGAMEVGLFRLRGKE